MSNNYDRIAPVYDRLASVIFGSSQINAQKYSLKFIRPGDKILIIGGGTGRVLEEIAEIYPSGLEIVYVEKSERMIELAQRRKREGNKIKFICADIADHASGHLFDVLLTAFLFDNFTEQFAGLVFHKLHRSLRQGGLWLYTDFELGSGSRLPHKILLKLMYGFFWLVAGVRVSKLPPMRRYFDHSGYQLKDQQGFYKGFIISAVFRKTISELR